VLEREQPPSIRFVHNNHAKAGSFVFFGSRLWDTTEYSVTDLIEWDPKKGPIPGSNGMMPGVDAAKQDEIYDHELQRLKISTSGLPDGVRIGLTHYPPLDHLLTPSRASKMLEDAGAKHVIFGHLHSVKAEWRGKAFGTRSGSEGGMPGTEYHLTACDYIGFRPKLICEI
jgi:predicted phosphohydrolase